MDLAIAQSEVWSQQFAEERTKNDFNFLADLRSQSEFKTQQKSQQKTNTNSEMIHCLSNGGLEDRGQVLGGVRKPAPKYDQAQHFYCVTSVLPSVMYSNSKMIWLNSLLFGLSTLNSISTALVYSSIHGFASRSWIRLVVSLIAKIPTQLHVS